MKILQINNHHKLRGGSEKVYHETIKLLKKNNHEVYFFSTAEIEEEYYESEDGFLIKYEDKKNLPLLQKITNTKDFIYNKKVANKLYDVIQNIKPDIIHLHIFYNVLSNSILNVIEKSKIPSVMSVHEYKMLCPAYTLLDNKSICHDCCNGNYLNAIKKKCVKENLAFSSVAALECYYRDYFTPYEKKITHFIMVSNFINNIHLKYKKELKNKTSVLYNFLNYEDFSKFERQKNNDGDYFIYFGRLSKEKGIITLIKSAISVGINLKIVGTGDQGERIKKLIANHKNIQLLGFKSGSELKNLVTNALYSITPSEWYENNPLSVIESFALKTPVIGATIGGIPELVQDSETGFLFESKNEADLNKTLIMALNYSKTDRYNDLKNNCFNFFKENCTEQVHYKKLITTYRSLL
ncbi:glycosyltransferase family 4 protein [Flammeovirga sp. EKP202]|uniref:glycosyltransferase family 4 protein n=1 Tax=Flammeovirga sp. EKP202 TaxID=2770592 RepID=UPI00165F8800|nr:glycosyltransferase family 4 protein [Flammeovirga sp. EKP202]MBD0404486.1 glycosyltransferase family 4 protein [Flammeovirga sp. EKP202]